MYKVKLFQNGVPISEHVKKTKEEVDTAVKIAEMFSTVTPSKKIYCYYRKDRRLNLFVHILKNKTG